jgi:hypothetical protein
MARETLFRLGPDASELLRADRTYIWVSKEAHIDIDLVDHETRLRSALPMSPGPPRDAALSEALSQEAALVRARTLKEFEGQRGRAQKSRTQASSSDTSHSRSQLVDPSHARRAGFLRCHVCEHRCQERSQRQP